MNVDTPLPLEVLGCPRCQRRLHEQEAGLRCRACKVDYPRVGGLPWLFAVPEAVRAEWRTRYARELHEADLAVARAATALKTQPPPRDSTRQRLARLAAGHAARGRELRELLAPLGATDAVISHEALLALRTRLPPTQGVTTYAQNVFRDWCWGDEENRLSAGIVAGQLGEAAGTVLVLGSGAGRLAYDLHQEGAQRWTLGLDLNPLLSFIGQRVAHGEALSLHEFPLAPRRLEDLAVARELRAPAPARPGLAFVLGDVVAPPLRPEVFDAVVAPWFVDIVEMDFAALAPRLAAWLKPGGRLVLFGSLSFSGAEPGRRYGFEEVLDILGEAGFGAPSVEERELPRELLYIADELERQGRPLPPAAALPDWLVAGRKPVPLTDAFRYQVAATRIHAYVMSLIDGKRSLRDIAREISRQGLMPQQDAEEAVRQFLITMWREAQQSDL